MGVTPLHLATIVGAQIAAQLSMTALGTIALLIAGRVVYGLHMPTAPLVMIPAIVLGGGSIFAIGFVMAAMLRTVRSAQVVGQALFFPMVFLSGATWPRADMPETVRRMGDFLPLTHVITLLQDLWFDQGWNLLSLAVLAGILAVGTLIGVRSFRWE